MIDVRSMVMDCGVNWWIEGCSNGGFSSQAKVE